MHFSVQISFFWNTSFSWGSCFCCDVNRCRLCEQNTKMLCILIIFNFSKTHKRRLWPQTKNQNTPRLAQLQMVNVIDIARQKYEVAAGVGATARARIYGDINLFSTFRISKLIKSNEILLFVHTKCSCSTMCCIIFRVCT